MIEKEETKIFRGLYEEFSLKETFGMDLEKMRRQRL